MRRSTELYWVRHGPTGTDRICGWTDIDCDLSMPATLAWINARLPADALVIASDLTRTRRTADALTGPRERLPDDPGLRELHFGHWEGLTAAAIAARDGRRSRTFWCDPTKAHPPGGERWDDLTQRVVTTIDGLMASHPGRPLVAVAHFGVILAHYMHITGKDWADGGWAHVAPLSLSRFVHDGSRWHAFSLNETHADAADSGSAASR